MSEPIRVLIADDEPAVRSLFEAILGERGDCEWQLASDGEEAFRKVAAYQPDVLITDLKMPRMSGEELTARAVELQPSLTVLVETGNPTLEGAVSVMRQGAVDFITKPFTLEDLRERLDRAFRRSRVRRTERPVAAIVESLVAALGTKDPYLEKHSRRVAILAGCLGRDGGLAPERVAEVEWAALVHDVGKIGISDAVLHKPGKLTDEEFREMKRHPIYSAEIVRPLARLHGGEGTVRAVYHHHERIDGRGYPDGIAGESIPLFSRIIGVCDTYDAMASQRPYRPALGERKILDILREVAGTQLDAGLVQVFLQNVNRYRDEIRGYRNDA